jgi:hypothetical protein
LSYSARVVAADVTDGRISIHQPTRRLLAALINALAHDEDSGVLWTVQMFCCTCADMLTALPAHLSQALVSAAPLSPSAPTDTDMAACVLLEHQLRVLVLHAQAHAGMWKRNGYALMNQLHNYMTPQCRVEMFDRDVLAVQVRVDCCSTANSHD